MKKIALLCLILALPTLSYGAITIDTQTTYEANGGSGATGAITIGSGSNRALLICRYIREDTGAVAADTSVPTVDGSTAGVTQIGTGITNSGNVVRAEAYYLLNPATGSRTVATSPAATTDRNMIALISLAGVHQSSPIGTPSTNQGGSTNMDVDGIASAVDDLVFLCGNTRFFATDNPAVASPDATSPVSTELLDVRHTGTSNGLSAVVYYEAGAATSTNIRVDLDDAVQWAAIGVAFQPAVAVATFGPLRRR